MLKKLMVVAAVVCAALGSMLTGTEAMAAPVAHAKPAATASPACGPVAGSRQGQSIQYCNLWPSSNIPVESCTETCYPNTWVGYLNKGGTANWFWCQVQSEYENESNQGGSDLWAKTEADNGAIGWVNEWWFAGNDGANTGLRWC